MDIRISGTNLRLPSELVERLYSDWEIILHAAETHKPLCSAYMSRRLLVGEREGYCTRYRFHRTTEGLLVLEDEATHNAYFVDVLIQFLQGTLAAQPGDSEHITEIAAAVADLHQGWV